MKTFTYTILGTHCPACKKIIEKRITSLADVVSADVDFETGAAKVIASRDITKQEIENVLSDTEYKLINE